MKIGIIIGSTREGRTTDRVALWVAKTAKQLDNFDVEVIDLREYELPFFDEAISPQYNPERKPEGVVKAWLDKAADKDGLIIVTPEYNRSEPAVLKNAIDYIGYEFDRKPVALVAHGSTGGAQAVSHLRGIIAGALAVTVPRAVHVTMAGSIINEAGELSAEVAANPYGPGTALETTLKDLFAYTSALAAIRQ